MPQSACAGDSHAARATSALTKSAARMCGIGDWAATHTAVETPAGSTPHIGSLTARRAPCRLRCGTAWRASVIAHLHLHGSAGTGRRPTDHATVLRPAPEPCNHPCPCCTAHMRLVRRASPRRQSCTHRACLIVYPMTPCAGPPARVRVILSSVLGGGGGWQAPPPPAPQPSLGVIAASSLRSTLSRPPPHL